MTIQHTQIHHPQQPVTELAIRDDQTRFDKFQLAALRTKGIDNVPTPEMMVFFHHCKTRGLDPLAGHATIVPFKERDGGKRWTIITEIDGFRYLGHREANRRGDIISIPEPVYVDQDGNETTHWVKPPTEPLGMVKQTILKNGAPFTGAASYWEFGNFARNKDGTPDYTRPQGKTRDMPANQTAKCAEAQAWRKTYQDVFADLPQQIDVQPEEPQGTPWHVAATIPKKLKQPGWKEVADEWERLGITDEDERLNLTARLAGTDTILDSLTDLPDAQLIAIADQLAPCDDMGQVTALLAAGDKPGT